MKEMNPWHDIKIGKDAPKIVNAIIEIPKDSHLKYELGRKIYLKKFGKNKK